MTPSSGRIPGTRWARASPSRGRRAPDGRVYEVTLRRGLKFHNGDPVTTEDVKFSFERYKGAGARELRARVAQVEPVDALTVRFHLREPWPDFMAFFGRQTPRFAEHGPTLGEPGIKESPHAFLGPPPDCEANVCRYDPAMAAALAPREPCTAATRSARSPPCCSP